MRKFLCGIIILLICCSLTLFSFAEENTIENTTSSDTQKNEVNESITTLQEKQEQLQKDMEKADKNLTDVQEELSDNLEQLQKLDDKIEQEEKELKELKQKIEKLSQNTEKLKIQLQIVTANYEKQKKLLEARLVAMYEAGETEYLDVILSSTDLSDFLSNYLLITEMASYDTELLEEVEEKKQIIELANQNLEDNLAQLDLIKKNKERDSKVLENIKKLREDFVTKLSKEEKEVQKQIDEYKKQFEDVNKEIIKIALSEGLSEEYVGGVMAWPVPGYTKITSNYGMRTHPITGVYKLHTGVDISAPIGAEFVAANDGIVTKAEYNSAYGNMVMIDHGGGISTLYAHGSEILVKVGQMVKREEPILKVGSTGYSTGPHAHFEVRINGVVTNPIEYITSSKIPESVKNVLTDSKDTTNTTNTVKKEETNTVNANNTANSNSI